eukprot:6213644-Pleurochrysis_carterae.AAC.4
MLPQDASAWSPPSKAYWHSKGLVHALLATGLTQEANILQAAEKLMNEWEGGGAVAVQLRMSTLKTYVDELEKKLLLCAKRVGANRAGPPHRQAAEAVRAAQVLRCLRRQLLHVLTENTMRPTSRAHHG